MIVQVEHLALAPAELTQLRLRRSACFLTVHEPVDVLFLLCGSPRTRLVLRLRWPCLRVADVDQASHSITRLPLAASSGAPRIQCAGCSTTSGPSQLLRLPCATHVELAGRTCCASRPHQACRPGTLLQLPLLRSAAQVCRSCCCRCCHVSIYASSRALAPAEHCCSLAALSVCLSRSLWERLARTTRALSVSPSRDSDLAGADSPLLPALVELQLTRSWSAPLEAYLLLQPADALS
jgi:hypothetical protein